MAAPIPSGWRRSSPAPGGTARRSPSARRSAIAPDHFTRFAAIDWSGAVGPRQPGIAAAICEAGVAAPQLVDPARIWSRQEVLDWLLDDLPANTLVGLDLGASLPFVDCDAYFPDWPDSPADAKALWALVDSICADDPHLAATSFVDHADASRHFRRHGGRKGDLFTGRGRLRVTEQAQARAGLRPYSNLNLVGAAQVGKSSLTGMRVLHRLDGRIPVWPFDHPDRGSAILEIYTSIAAIAASRPVGRTKMRSGLELDTALAAIGSAPAGMVGAMDDHKSDAILTAAWLRANASRDDLWHPPAMTVGIAATEGWTFGIA